MMSLTLHPHWAASNPPEKQAETLEIKADKMCKLAFLFISVQFTLS